MAPTALGLVPRHIVSVSFNRAYSQQRQRLKRPHPVASTPICLRYETNHIKPRR